MRNILSKRAGIIVLTVSIGAIVLAVWVFFAGERRRDTQSVPRSFDEIDQVAQVNDQTYSIVDHTSVDLETASAQDSLNMSQDLVAACPDPSADLSDECIATLDAVFATKMMGRLHLDWIKFDSPSHLRRFLG